MNDWKRILEHIPDNNTEQKKFQTTEINIKISKQKRILGINRTVFIIGVAAISLALIICGAWFLIAVNEVRDYDRIYPGVTVLDINLGGMTKEEAVKTVRDYSNNYYSGKQIVLRCLDKTAVIAVKDAVQGIDADDAAELAYEYGRDKGVLKRYGLLKSGKTHQLEIQTNYQSNEEYIESVVDELISAVDQEYKYYSVQVLSDGVQITRGSDGVHVKREELINDIKTKLAENDFSDITVEPEIQKAEVPDADQIRSMVYVEPKNAALVKTGTKSYRIEDAQKGVDIDVAQMKADLAATDWDTKFYPFIYTNQLVTRSKLESVLFKDVLASVTTTINVAETNRTTNIRLAAGFIDGTVLLPGTVGAAGETFSFNNVVGERTEARGFKVAKVFANGEVVDGVGGGICQVSSTLFDAALYADMDITERHAHMFAVSYVDGGYDATVQYGYLDFAFQNSSQYPIRLSVKLSNNSLTVTIYGTITDPNRRVELRSEKLSEITYTTQNKLDTTLPYGSSQVVQKGVNGGVYKLYQTIYQGNTPVEVNEYQSSYSAQTEIINWNPLPS